MKLFVFPRWANKTRQLAGLALGVTPVYLTAFIWYGFSPKTTDVGYMPEQPVPYSHALHVGELGMDCRYCHNTVEKAAHAAVPPTETCMNCHTRVRTDSPRLLPVRASSRSTTCPTMPTSTTARTSRGVSGASRATVASTRWSKSISTNLSAWAGASTVIAPRKCTFAR
jgi:hypothetical protein